MPVYEPLTNNNDETRVLRVSPVLLQRASLSFKLETVSLAEDPDLNFHALSYSQGDEEKTETITVDGEAMEVAPSLHAALKELRTRKITSIWVDCICINQDDKGEKGRQVAIMGTIYMRAKRVYAWLGPKYDNSSVAMKLLGHRKYPHVPGNGRLSPRSIAHIENQRLSGEQTTAIQKLLDRRYWERAWIIQETSLNRDVYVLCGKKTVHLDIFLEILGMRYKASGQLLLPQKRNELIEAIKGFRERPNQKTLVQAWLGTRRYLAQLPRDKLYALRAISSDGHLRIPMPSYSADEKRIYFDVTKQMIQAHQLGVILLAQNTPHSRQHDSTISRVSVFDTIEPSRSLEDNALSIVDRVGRRTHGLRHRMSRFVHDSVRPTKPEGESAKFLRSWVPNWGDAEYEYPRWVIDAASEVIKLDEKSSAGVCADQILKARGVVLETIETTTAYTGDPRDSARYCAETQTRSSKAKSMDSQYVLENFWYIVTRGTEYTKDVTGQWLYTARPVIARGVVDALAATIAAIACRDYHDTGSCSPFAKWIALNYAVKIGGTSLQGHAQIWQARVLREPGSDPHVILATSEESELNRGLSIIEGQQMRIAVTNKGRFRLVYREALVGDQIIQFRGCSLPVVLRPLRSGKQYSVIGEMLPPGDHPVKIRETLQARSSVEGQEQEFMIV